MYFNRKYAHQGRAVMFYANVGGGKTKAAPHFFAMHDAAVYRVGAAEQGCGVLNSGRKLSSKPLEAAK